MNHRCTDCHTPIPAGLAVIRSSTFHQLAYHRSCWDARHPAPVIPAQRPAPARSSLRRLLGVR